MARYCMFVSWEHKDKDYGWSAGLRVIGEWLLGFLGRNKRNKRDTPAFKMIRYTVLMRDLLKPLCFKIYHFYPQTRCWNYIRNNFLTIAYHGFMSTNRFIDTMQGTDAFNCRDIARIKFRSWMKSDRRCWMRTRSTWTPYCCPSCGPYYIRSCPLPVSRWGSSYIQHPPGGTGKVPACS